MPLGGYLRRWLPRLVWGLVLAVALHGLGALPGLAQLPETEPVFLDGLFLFDVPAAGDLTAAERALAIETNLGPLVEAADPVSVQAEVRRIEGSDGATLTRNPVIFAGDRYIMTVTNVDAEVGGTDDPEAQADQWTNAIAKALSQAQVERQSGFLVRAIAQALAALAAALLVHWLAGRLWHRWLRPFLDRFAFSPIDPDNPEHEVTGLNLFFRFTRVST